MKSDQQRLDEQFPIYLASDTVATFIPYRSPEFKVHSKAGLAHNALGQRGYREPKAKYELVDGVWHRTWAYYPPTVCRHCDRLYKDVKVKDHWGSTRGSDYYDDPSYTGPKWARLPVCKECAVAIQEEAEKAEADMGQREAHERYLLN